MLLMFLSFGGSRIPIRSYYLQFIGGAIKQWIRTPLLANRVPWADCGSRQVQAWGSRTLGTSQERMELWDCTERGRGEQVRCSQQVGSRVLGRRWKIGSRAPCRDGLVRSRGMQAGWAPNE